MKRVRCPKCNNYITFDETQYETGQQLVFECSECHHQFGIRMGSASVQKTRKEEDFDEDKIGDDADVFAGMDIDDLDMNVELPDLDDLDPADE